MCFAVKILLLGLILMGGWVCIFVIILLSLYDDVTIHIPFPWGMLTVALHKRSNPDSEGVEETAGPPE
jgi:hypothetical protein